MAYVSPLLEKWAAEAEERKKNAPTPEEVAAENPMQDLVPTETKKEKPKQTPVAERTATETELPKAVTLPTFSSPFTSPTRTTEPVQQSTAPVVNGPSASTQNYVTLTEEEKQRRAEEAARLTAQAIEDNRKLEEQRAADQAIMDADLAEYATWSPEDQTDLGTYIENRPEGFGGIIKNIAAGMSGSGAEAAAAGQRNVAGAEAYNRLAAKYGKDKVKAMAETVQRQQNAKNAEQMTTAATEAVAGKPGAAILGSLATMPANLGNAITGPLGIASDFATKTGRYSTLDSHNAGNLLGEASGALRGQVAGDIAGENGGVVRQGAALAYQGVMSLADSLARSLTMGTAGGATLAATGSFTQAVADASAQGASPAQAVAMGVATAGMEYLTEKIPMDEVFKTAKNGDAKVLREMFKQAGIEISTEELSLFGTMAAEAAILREKSSYKQTIADAVAHGASYDEAKAQADNAVWQEVWQTAAVSGFSGMAAGGSSAIVGKVFGESNIAPTQEEQHAQAAPAPAVAPVAEQTAVQPQAAEVTAAAQTEAAAPAQLTQQQMDENAVRMMAEELVGVPQQEAQGKVEENLPPQQEAQDTAQPAEVAQPAAPEEPQSAGIKGTGAAEQNFSGKSTYQDLLYEGNVQPDRASDVRPMEVPKTNAEGENVSAVAANAYGSQFTPDDLAGAVEDSIAKGELSYVKIDNQEAAQKAAKKIEGAGSWENAYIEWRDSVRDGRTGAEMAARGAMLLNNAAESYEQAKATGDADAIKSAKTNWLSVLSDLRSLGTNTAQGLQAMRLIRELAPPDKLEFAKMTVRKMVADMKLHNDITIDENLLDAYQNAETDEARDEVMKQIQQNVAKQIPSTILDKWNALRYMNMLGNLKTNVRNVAGNVANAVMYRLKDQTAALAEDFISAFNKNYQRTKSHTVSKELLDFARKDFQIVKEAVGSGGKYNDRMAASDEFRQGVMDKRKIFKNPLMEGYRKATNWMMNNEIFGDEAFGRAAYARAMAGYLKANGINAKNLDSVSADVLDKARAYAVQQAQEATFHDNTALAQIASKLQKDTGMLGQAIMPFTKTPANVLTRAVEFSPLGILDTARKSAQMALSKTGAVDKDGIIGNIARGGENITGADIVDSLAKTFTGSMLFALGAILGDQWFLSGGPDGDDEEDAFAKLNGRQDYALQFNIDGKQYSYTIDWLTPAAMPMFMGAEFWKAISTANGEVTFADLENVFTSIGDPLIQMSMLQGLNDSLDGIKYSENNLGQFMINAAVSYLTQGLTNTLLGQIERSTEENRQTTYIDKSSNVPEWMQRALGKASQKIPGWDYQQMDYRNAWGETEKQEGGDLAGKLAYNLASPGYFGEEVSTELSEELNRLSLRMEGNVYPNDPAKSVTYTDKNGQIHENHQLTEEQYQKLAQTQGQTAKTILDRMVTSRDYKNLTDDQKAATIQAVYEYAKEQGMQAALGKDYYSKAAEWISKATKHDLTTFITQGSKTALNKVVANTVNSLANDWTVTKAAKDDLEQSYRAFSKMPEKTQQQILEEAASDTVKYLLARKDGVRLDTYLSATDAIKALEPPEGKVNVRPAQKYEAIANTKGATEAEKDALIRAYMDDYDPNSSSPDTTELKYNYAREEMGLSPEEYAKVQLVYSEIYNTGLAEVKAQGYSDKEAAYKSKWIASGLSRAQADTLYNLLVTSSKNKKIDVVEWSKTK